MKRVVIHARVSRADARALKRWWAGRYIEVRIEPPSLCGCGRGHANDRSLVDVVGYRREERVGG